MEERRREPRLRSLLSGRMTFNARNCAMSCMVRNVSPNGAMIIFSDMFRMPETFDLNIPQHDETRNAKVIWRRRDAAGLALSPAEAAAETPRAAARKNWLQGSRPRERKGMVLGY